MIVGTLRAFAVTELTANGTADAAVAALAASDTTVSNIQGLFDGQMAIAICEVKALAVRYPWPLG